MTGTPAAPSAAPSNGASAPAAPANGAASSSALKPTQAAPAARSGAPKPTPARVAGGRFGPKDGAVGAAEGSPEAKQAETAAAEARRLRLKLKTRNGEEDWEGDESDVQRELQQGRAYARKVQELTQAIQAREAEDKLYEKDPDEFFRKRGVDPQQYAIERVKALVDLEAMSEEGRALHDERSKREALEKRLAERESADKKVKEEILSKQLRDRRVKTYAAALKATGVPLETDAEKREMIYRMAQTEAIVADEQGRHDFTPDELAKETVRRAKKDGQFFLNSLTTQQLVSELGQERLTALLQHSVAEYERAQGMPAAPPRQETPSEPPEPGQSPYLDEREFERRQRAKRLERQGRAR